MKPTEKPARAEADLSETDRAALREAAEKATPGPWMNFPDAVRGDPDGDGWSPVAETPCPRSPVNSARYRQWNADARFMALANPASVKRLLAERDVLAEQVERLTREVGEVRRKLASVSEQESRQRWQAKALASLQAMREAGWSVAVHNDYRLNGEAMTFWLFTHPDGRWAKGEGRCDGHALDDIARAALTQSQEPTNV